MTFFARIVVAPSEQAIREVLLIHAMAGEVVWVAVALGVALGLHELGGRVAKVEGNRQRARLSDLGRGLAVRQVARVALRRGGQVGGGVAQRNPPLGYPNRVEGLKRGDRHRQPLRVGIPHVFRREDHHAPRNEQRVFPRLQHSREPIDRRVGIAAAQALDERRGHVVMLFTALVEEQHPVLGGLADLVLGEDALLRTGRAQGDRLFEEIQRPARVAFGPSRDLAQQRRIAGHASIAQPALAIAQRPAQERHHLLDAQRLQREDFTAREQGRVDFEAGVLGGGPHQDNRPVLDVVQERILLAAVEPVDFVDEENRLLAALAPRVRLRDQFQVSDRATRRR